MKKLIMALVILGALGTSYISADSSIQQASGDYEVAGMQRGA